MSNVVSPSAIPNVSQSVSVSQSPTLQNNLIDKSDYLKGVLWGGLGVILFSGGIPATKLAVAELPSLFVGTGRALVAAILSVILLWALKQKLPAKQHWPALAIVAFGAVFAYPIFSSIAMQTVDANHGILTSSIMPLFTAIFGSWLSHQWPKIGFWCCALVGAGTVVIYASKDTIGYLAVGDLWLLMACFCCGLSYAQGGLLARQIGSWQVICWALVFSIPVLLPLSIYASPPSFNVSWSSWLGFGYLSLFSMFLGFFAWYKGLALGGVAQISQLQLLTPFIAFGLAAVFLGEVVTQTQWLVATVVIICIGIGRKLA